MKNFNNYFTLFVIICASVSDFAECATIKSEVLSNYMERGLNEAIINFIEDFKKQMPCGVPALGIPVLVPLEVKDGFQFNVNVPHLINLDISTHDMLIDGLNDFDIKSIDIKLLQFQVDFSVRFNKINAKGLYDISGDLVKIFPIDRKGPFELTVRGGQIDGFAKIKPKEEYIELTDFKIKVLIDQLESNVEHVFPGLLLNLLFNRILEAALPDFFQSNQQQVTEYIESLLLPEANRLLDGVTVSDILDMINGAQNSTVLDNKCDF
uniref:Putative juvenile hormone binding protein n=1 Tax=Corethrella appendiculata TaxID=1370023 RepID=U5ENR6_9DIPT